MTAFSCGPPRRAPRQYSSFNFPLPGSRTKDAWVRFEWPMPLAHWELIMAWLEAMKPAVVYEAKHD